VTQLEIVGVDVGRPSIVRGASAGLTACVGVHEAALGAIAEVQGPNKRSVGINIKGSNLTLKRSSAQANLKKDDGRCAGIKGP
jgi:hypothetical protein